MPSISACQGGAPIRQRSACSTWNIEFQDLPYRSRDVPAYPEEVPVTFQFGKRRFALVFMTLCFIASGLAQEMPSDYQEVLKLLDKKGDFKAGVLKVNIPRNDLKMTIQGVSTPTPFGFGGWIALTKAANGSDVMMGDLVLLQDEVNPVL